MTAVTDRRIRELAQIHIAKKQLGLDDETYREMLFTLARVRTASVLDDYGRRRVLDHLRARGFSSARGKAAFPGRPHNCDSNPLLKKIEALLAHGRKPWAYGDAMAARMFHVDRIAFCNDEQLRKIVAALSYQQSREHKRG